MVASAQPARWRARWRARLANAWWDLLAVLTGYCNASAWRLARDNPIEWRCARQSGHPGLHRHGAYRWDDTGRLYRDLVSEPAVYQPRSRHPLPTLRQARLIADPEARRLAVEGLLAGAAATVSASAQVRRARPAGERTVHPPVLDGPGRGRHAAPDWPAIDVDRPPVTAPNSPRWRQPGTAAAVANRRVGVGRRLVPSGDHHRAQPIKPRRPEEYGAA